MRIVTIILSITLLTTTVACQQRVIVSQAGDGDFTSIQAAIDHLPDSSARDRTIFIKKGIYSEKLFIKKHRIIFEGEDKSNTIIKAAIARDEWRCEHPDDWGVATINVGGNDITLKNLTITNSFAYEFTGDRTIACAADSGAQKKITKYGHQMALRTMYSTRLKAINCHFKSLGGDTVSPWQVENGLWYFKNCIMEGGVDFYCPRGWAWAENCEFIAHGGTAAIWHDGSRFEDSKTVLKNCTFKGYDGFLLGRYHRDAQFYLIGCRFADNMLDKPVYQVSTTNTLNWGHRVYYYDCHRETATDFAWHANHLPAGVQPKDITIQWVFGNNWNPEIN